MTLKQRFKRIKAWFKANLNRVKLPGMQGLGLYSVMRFFWQGLREQNLQLGAMAIAFRAFFALIPALMILLSLVKYVPVDNLEAQISQMVTDLMPGSSGDQLIHSLLQGSGPGLFSVSLLLLLVSATGAVKVMIHAFHRNDEFMVKRKFLHLNLTAIGIFSLLLLLFLFTAAAIIYGDLLLARFSDDGGTWGLVLLRLFHGLIVLLSIILAISVAYYYGPNMDKRFDFISPGSVMAGVLVLVAGLIFRLFVRYFFNFELYAGLSAIMLIMLWFYWVSFVVLMGFELNRAITRLKRMHDSSRN